MRAYFYEGAARLDWGFGNPNVTGSIIVLLMLASWLLAYLPQFWGKIGFFFGLISNLTLGVCLVETYSRGAAVSLLAGAVVLIWYAPRPWGRLKAVALVLTSVALIIFSFQNGFSSRSFKGISGEDRSITNRWLIYKIVPRMIFDAPGGWGHERAAEAFHQWYQPPGRRENYGRLVSSHATWLVEWPWHLRLGYLGGWIFILCLSMPNRSNTLPFGGSNLSPGSNHQGNPPASKWFSLLLKLRASVKNEKGSPRTSVEFASVSLGLWLAFFVGACFTTTAHWWVMWVLPCFALLLVLVTRFWHQSWPSVHVWKGGASALLSVTILIVIWALLTPSELSLKGGTVTINAKGSKSVWVFPGIDESVQGQLYGHRIRSYCKTAEACVLVRWIPGAILPPTANARIICPGKATSNLQVSDEKIFREAVDIQLVNPDQPTPWLLQLVKNGLRAKCKIGDFADGQSVKLWEDLASSKTKLIIERVNGTGRYIPDTFE